VAVAAGNPQVTGPDLLGRTIFYKVGHHGSHNATLREQGLEQMKNLRTAVIPVDHDVALKMRWGAMPLETAGRRARQEDRRTRAANRQEQDAESSRSRASR